MFRQETSWDLHRGINIVGSTLENDVVRIISEDPRWEFVEVNTLDSEHSVTVDVTLIYRPENEVTTLPLEFDKGEF